MLILLILYLPLIQSQEIVAHWTEMILKSRIETNFYSGRGTTNFNSSSFFIFTSYQQNGIVSNGVVRVDTGNFLQFNEYPLHVYPQILDYGYLSFNWEAKPYIFLSGGWSENQEGFNTNMAVPKSFPYYNILVNVLIDCGMSQFNTEKLSYYNITSSGDIQRPFL
jgi:hypothetical protein